MAFSIQDAMNEALSSAVDAISKGMTPQEIMTPNGRFGVRNFTDTTDYNQLQQQISDQIYKKMSEADPSRPYEGVQEYNQRTRYGRMDNANYIPTNHPGVASAQQVINNAKNQVAPRFRPQQIVREPSRGDLHILPVLPNMQRHRGPKDISIMPVGMVQPLDGNQQLHTMPYFQQQPQTVQTQGLVSATSLPNPTNNFRYLPRDGFAPQIVPRVSNAPSPIPLRNTLY